MSICQFKNMTNSILLASFCTLLLSGCADTPVAPVRKVERPIVAQWFKLPLRFSHRDFQTEGAIVHPFFDIDPKIENLKDKEPENYGIQYFVSTPEASKYQYNIDLYSGQLYRERTFCSQDDIWNTYSGDIITPNFTQGFVPRVYDENKKPQRIMVISKKEFIEPFKQQPINYDDARILGSVLLEHCEKFPCDQQDRWKASQILIGVSTRDPIFNKLDGLRALKKMTNWDYAKGMLTNMQGYHKLGEKIYPAYRISRELNLKDTVAYFQKNAEIIDAAKLAGLNSWRMGCMKLYDSMWSESEKIRSQTHSQADNFLKFFKEFYKKNVNEFYQCQTLVRPGTIVEDYRRLWFFSYIQAFVLLEKSGFYYNCTQNGWTYNPRTDDTNFLFDQGKELERCRAKTFEKAFDQAINGMSLMKSQTNRQYRFVEYDNMRGGSHQKIYGWIYERPQDYACKYQSKTPEQSVFDIFPQDVVWENFKQDENGVVR